MAKLSAHGAEIGRIYFTTYAKAYMADGKILKNHGFGWKLHGKLKAGIAPADAYKRALEHHEQFMRERPALAAYRKALHAIAGLSKRWKIATAVEMMPDDPDGVWSEACDSYGDNVSADLDEVVELCTLYRAAIAECDAMKQTA